MRYNLTLIAIIFFYHASLCQSKTRHYFDKVPAEYIENWPSRESTISIAAPDNFKNLLNNPNSDSTLDYNTFAIPVGVDINLTERTPYNRKNDTAYFHLKIVAEGAINTSIFVSHLRLSQKSKLFISSIKDFTQVATSGPNSTAKIIRWAKCAGLNIFPNPASSHASIIITDDDDASQKRINKLEVTDLFGKVLVSQSFSFNSKSANVKISTSTFTEGIYIVRVFDGTGWRTDKLVVNR